MKMLKNAGDGLDALPTRKIIEALYDTQRERIVSPGKFEGEPTWTPYFYARLNVEGPSDQYDWPDGTLSSILDVRDEERSEWGIAQGIVAMLLIESDEGFVSCLALTEALRDADASRNTKAWEYYLTSKEYQYSGGLDDL